jgi:hypothetical protein
VENPNQTSQQQQKKKEIERENVWEYQQGKNEEGSGTAVFEGRKKSSGRE